MHYVLWDVRGFEIGVLLDSLQGDLQSCASSEKEYCFRIHVIEEHQLTGILHCIG